MGSLNFYSPFTDIPLEKNNGICTNTLFQNNERVKGLSKI